MMVINKAETQEGISLIIFFLTAIRTVPYCWLHSSTSLIGKVVVWSCSFCRTQTIHLRLANNMFTGRKCILYHSQTSHLRV
jgi:hypothetical protein